MTEGQKMKEALAHPDAYKVGREDGKTVTIEKACEWIRTTPMYAKQPSQLVEEFKQAMEE